MFFVLVAYLYFISPIVIKTAGLSLLDQVVLLHLLEKVRSWLMLNEVDVIDWWGRW